MSLDDFQKLTFIEEFVRNEVLQSISGKSEESDDVSKLAKQLDKQAQNPEETITAEDVRSFNLILITGKQGGRSVEGDSAEYIQG